MRDFREVPLAFSRLEGILNPPRRDRRIGKGRGLTTSPRRDRLRVGGVSLGRAVVHTASGTPSMKKLLALAVALFVVAPVARAADEKTIAEIAVGNKDFSTLVAAAKAAGLVDALGAKGPITVFAPTNEAFAKLGKETLDKVLADKELLTKILKAHIVKGNVMAADVLKMDGKKVNGFAIKIDGETVMIGKATVTKADIKASNGVIHVIDTVLVPTGK